MQNNNINKKNLRTFALIWCGIFLVFALYPMHKGLPLRTWSIFFSLSFFTVGLIKPEIFKYFYLIWVKLGGYIGKIISYIVMALLFFSLFTLTSLTLKILRKDLLNKKIIKKAQTYWLHRETPIQSMKKQF